MNGETARALAEERRSELLDLLRELIAAPSPYGSSGRKAQEIAAAYLEARGYQSELTSERPLEWRAHPDFTMPPGPTPEEPVNLRAYAGSTPHPGLALLAHVDTEQSGDGWSSNPYELVERDGRVCGLGAADDKGGLATALVAATILAALGCGPVVLSVHGKGGGARGTLPVIAGLRRYPGATIYLHPAETGHGLQELKHASRGVADFGISLAGWRGPPREIRTLESASFVEGGDALAALLAGVERLRRHDLTDCEINLGRVAAGERAGLTPDRCDAELRVLFAEPRTVQQVGAVVRAAIESSVRSRSADTRQFRYTISEGTRANPASTPWDGGACVTLRDAVRQVTGSEPAPYGGHLASDIRFPIRLLGAAGVGVGSLAGNFYGPDEWVDVDDLVRLVAVTVVFGNEWTG